MIKYVVENIYKYDINMMLKVEGEDLVIKKEDVLFMVLMFVFILI